MDKDWTASFPEIVRAARSMNVKSALLDGEVCVVEPDGPTNFQALRNESSGRARASIASFVFDLLYLNGRRLLSEPLESRKQTLETLVPARPEAGVRHRRIHRSRRIARGYRRAASVSRR